MMHLPLDKYARQARLVPALLVVLPLLLAWVAYFPEWRVSWLAPSGLLVTFGVGILLANVSRAIGRRKESELFEQWGEKPTVRLLRHRAGENPEQLVRWHKKLQDLFPELQIPTREEEEEDPERADLVYSMCVDSLRERTRDQEQFHVLFQENCNYGFRRNLWALKPFGLIFSVLGLVVVGGLIVQSLLAGKELQSIPVAFGFINVLIVVAWLALITPKWVKEQADTYARQLVASCETQDAIGG